MQTAYPGFCEVLCSLEEMPDASNPESVNDAIVSSMHPIACYNRQKHMYHPINTKDGN